MKNSLIALSVISSIAIVILVVYLVMKKKQETNADEITSNRNSSSDFPLKYNLFLQLDKVKELQVKLNNKLVASIEPNFPKDNSGVYIKSLKEDGYFGDKTLAVVKYFCDGQEEVTEEMFNAL